MTYVQKAHGSTLDATNHLWHKMGIEKEIVMAVKWIRLKQPYGYRHISEETPMIIEQFFGGAVELWFIPSYPTFEHRRCRDVREAKYFVNKHQPKPWPPS